MATVAILPWLWSEQAISLNEFRLVPIDRRTHVFTPTADDRFDIDVFEQLACEEHFAVLGEGQRHPWHVVRSEARSQLLHAQLVAMLTPPSAPASDALPDKL